MKWSNIRKIKSTELLKEIEKQFSVSLPEEYKNLVKVYNAGIPNCTEFSLDGKSFFVERLISVNKDDEPNILSAVNWIDQRKDGLIIPIALDQDSNMISIKINTNGYSIVLIGFENGDQCFLANNLNDFLMMLKED